MYLTNLGVVLSDSTTDWTIDLTGRLDALHGPALRPRRHDVPDLR